MVRSLKRKLTTINITTSKLGSFPWLSIQNIISITFLAKIISWDMILHFDAPQSSLVKQALKDKQ